MKETCDNCRFYVCYVYNSQQRSAARYECRRHSPIVALAERGSGGSGGCPVTMFPEVTINHWCGEWEVGEKVDREAVVTELREVIRFALDKCRSRTAGNLVDPFAYLYQQDWDDFVGMALKAGVFVQKEEITDED